MVKRKKKLKEKSAGNFVQKTSCPECHSHDNLAIYEHDDGSYSATCFGADCEKSYVNWDLENDAPMGSEPRNTFNEDGMGDDFSYSNKEEKRMSNLPTLEQIMEDCIAVDLPDRKLRENILEHYGVKVALQDDGETIDKHYYPTYRDGTHVGFRRRSRFPMGHEDAGKLKDFNGVIGDAKKGIEFFGQWVVTPEKYKRVIVMEGEIDAMTGFHVMSSHDKYPEHYAGCVSVPSGANISGIKPQLDYLNKFSEIYLAFDNDEAGEKLLEKAVKLLPVGKVRIVRLPKGIKDLNQWWCSARNAGDRKNVINGFWNAIFKAEKYSPAGIKSMSEGWSSYLNRGKEILIPFPKAFGDMNTKTCGGYALGEIITIAAPSSVGKSSFIKEMIYTALAETNYNIGICSFEETLDEFIEGVLSVHMSTQLNEVSYDERDRGAEWAAFQELLQMKGACQDLKKAVAEIQEEDEEAGDRIHFLDHQGACDGEALLDKIDFLVKGLDCKIIILDPVTLALSGSDMEEDEFASEVVKRTKRDKLAWINVHHVRKNGGGTKANSEGGEIAEEDMKGSGVWFQTSMINLLLTRNKVHPNEVVRNTTKLKMSKCRRHGKNTGIAGYTFYDGETGRLHLGQDPTEIEEAEANGMGEDFSNDKAGNSFGDRDSKNPEGW